MSTEQFEGIRVVANWLQSRIIGQEKLLERLMVALYNGETILASRLGYRINDRFVRRFFGRIFDNPTKVFDESTLCPESQDEDAFADGIQYITGAHRTVAQAYLEDGSVNEMVPPLRALIHIMANDEFEGMKLTSPEFRRMFERDYVLQSDWYRERLATKQGRDIAHWTRQLEYVSAYETGLEESDPSWRQEVESRHQYVQEQLDNVKSAAYLDALTGTIGAQKF